MRHKAKGNAKSQAGKGPIEGLVFYRGHAVDSTRRVGKALWLRCRNS